MNRRLHSRTQDGFTLIELLVVILTIGILAAIALPAFLGQRAKANDGRAKSNARALVSEMESCYTEVQRYDACPGSDNSVELGNQPGQVEVTGAGDEYVIVSYSRSGNTFTITKKADQTVERTCSDAGSAQGGCNGGVW